VRDVNDVVRMADIARLYNHRNQSIAFVSHTAKWTPWHATDVRAAPQVLLDGSDSDEPYTVVDLDIVMRVPQGSVEYIPGAGEIIKQFWMQWLAVAVLVWYVWSWVRYILVMEGVVDSVLEKQDPHAH
jgi:hypothetical protein